MCFVSLHVAHFKTNVLHAPPATRFDLNVLKTGLGHRARKDLGMAEKLASTYAALVSRGEIELACALKPQLADTECAGKWVYFALPNPHRA